MAAAVRIGGEDWGRDIRIGVPRPQQGAGTQVYRALSLSLSLSQTLLLCGLWGLSDDEHYDDDDVVISYRACLCKLERKLGQRRGPVGCDLGISKGSRVAGIGHSECVAEVCVEGAGEVKERYKQW